MGMAAGLALSAQRPALGLLTKLSYGFGAVANGAAVAALSGAILQIYLNQVLGLPALLVGTTIMVSLMVDALIDPLIGRWSDRTRSRWGRRHPFMYASALPVAGLFYILWNAPAGLGDGALAVFTLAMMIAVRVAISVYAIPGDALTPELTPSYDERTTLLSYRWFFGIIAGAGMNLALAEVFLRVGPHNPLGILNRSGYGEFGVLGAAVLLVSILVCAMGTHSRIGQLPQAARRPPVPMRQSLREIRLTLTNRSLVALMLGGVLGGVGGGVTTGLSIYFYTHFWGLGPAAFGLLIPLGSVGAIVAVFLAPPLSHRFGKKAAMIGLFSISVGTAGAPILLRLLHLMVANGSPWLLPILVADATVTAVVATVGYILVGSMMADVVEDTAVKSGVRSEGLLFAVNGLLPKFTGGIGAFIAGLMLTVVHFPPHAMPGTVSPQLMRHLALIYLPISAFFSIVSIAVLGFYRIDRATHEKNLATLREAAAMATVNHAVEGLESGDAPVPVTRMY